MIYNCAFYLCLHIKSFSVLTYIGGSYMFKTVLSEDKVVTKVTL
jgi:hypothetical protein